MDDLTPGKLVFLHNRLLGSTVRQFRRLRIFESLGVTGMVVKDVVLHLTHVQKPKLTVRALMDDGS